MNKLGITCTAFAIAGLAALPVGGLSAADAEGNVVAIDAAKRTITVSSAVIEPAGLAVVAVEAIPARLKVGDPVVVAWDRKTEAFVLVNPRK